MFGVWKSLQCVKIKFEKAIRQSWGASKTEQILILMHLLLTLTTKASLRFKSVFQDEQQ